MHKVETVMKERMEKIMKNEICKTAQSLVAVNTHTQIFLPTEGFVY